MTVEQAAFLALDAWQGEVSHRGLKRLTGIERGQYRLEVPQRNHVGLAIRGCVWLDPHRLQFGLSYLKAKSGIDRNRIQCEPAESDSDADYPGRSGIAGGTPPYGKSRRPIWLNGWGKNDGVPCRQTCLRRWNRPVESVISYSLSGVSLARGQ